MSNSSPIPRAALAKALGVEPWRITEWVARNVIFGKALVPDHIRKGQYGYLEDTCRRQVQAHMEGRRAGTGTAEGGKGAWGDQQKAYGVRVKRMARLAKCPDKTEIILKPTRSQFGMPIRDVDPKTRALIDAALEERRV